MSLREQIASVKDYELEQVFVPEWNTDIYLRSITVGERVKLYTLLDDKTTESRLSIWLVMFCLTEADGKRVFTEDDYDLIASKNAKVIDRLGKRAAELNMMMATAVEDSKKNSAPTQS